VERKKGYSKRELQEEKESKEGEHQRKRAFRDPHIKGVLEERMTEKKRVPGKEKGLS